MHTLTRGTARVRGRRTVKMCIKQHTSEFTRQILLTCKSCDGCVRPHVSNLIVASRPHGDYSVVLSVVCTGTGWNIIMVKSDEMNMTQHRCCVLACVGMTPPNGWVIKMVEIAIILSIPNIEVPSVDAGKFIWADECRFRSVVIALIGLSEMWYRAQAQVCVCVASRTTAVVVVANFICKQLNLDAYRLLARASRTHTSAMNRIRSTQQENKRNFGTYEAKKRSKRRCVHSAQYDRRCSFFSFNSLNATRSQFVFFGRRFF